jgi:hypothetical protein
MSIPLGQLVALCRAAHGRPLPTDAAVYGVMDLDDVPHERALAVLIADSDRHRVPVPLAAAVRLRAPDQACVCLGTGAQPIVGGVASLCARCMGGDFARTWVR